MIFTFCFAINKLSENSTEWRHINIHYNNCYFNTSKLKPLFSYYAWNWSKSLWCYRVIKSKWHKLNGDRGTYKCQGGQSSKGNKCPRGTLVQGDTCQGDKWPGGLMSRGTLVRGTHVTPPFGWCDKCPPDICPPGHLSPLDICPPWSFVPWTFVPLGYLSPLVIFSPGHISPLDICPPGIV